jgi:serine protease Do
MTMRRFHAVLRHLFVAASLLAVAASSPVFADDSGPDRSHLITRLLPTVVNISVKKYETAAPVPSTTEAGSPIGPAAPGATVQFYVGSGFVIDPSGLILTNYHVVQDAYDILVVFSNGTRLKGSTLSASRIADLAIVKVTTGVPLQAAPWGDSDLVQVGDQVFAAGNPFGIGLSVSAGIVSGLNRDLQDSAYDDLIQTDATINHGNSGGPLFDMQGNVIGVNSVILSPSKGSAGLGFAIPSNSARFVVDRLRQYGWVRPGWIGVKVQQMTPDLAAAQGVEVAGGSIICWVLPDSPAQKAGLAIGDVILRLNGKVPVDDRALLREIVRSPPAITLTLTIRRNGEERDVPIIAEAWPRNQWDARDAPLPVEQPRLSIPPDLGLSMTAIAEEDKAKLGLADGLTGVMVSGVAANSDPQRRGMTAGDIVLRVQNDPVATPDEVQAGFDAVRTAKRDFVQVLVLPKVRTAPGPKWVALQLGTAAN